MTLGWTGPLGQELKGTTPRQGLHHPEDGTLFWLDTWVMLAEAPHPNGSYAWLDFIQAPADPGQGDRTTTVRDANDGRRSSRAGDAQRPRDLPARAT